MKENNSITAEDIKTRILKGISEVFRGKTIYMKDIEEDVEQYAQAKVLEALEREVPKAYKEGVKYWNGDEWKLIDVSRYYETEVKPKYE